MPKKKLNRDFSYITNRNSGLVFNRQIKQNFGQIGHQHQQNGGGATSGNEINCRPSLNNSKSSIFARLGVPILNLNRGENSENADANINPITTSHSLFKKKIDQFKGQLNGLGQSTLPQRTHFLNVNEPLPPPKLPKFLSFKIQISNPDAQPPSPLNTPQSSPVKNNEQISHNSSSTSNEIDNDNSSGSDSESENVLEDLQTSQDNTSDQELELEEDNSEESQMEEKDVSLNEEDFVAEEDEYEYEIIEEEMEIDEEIEDTSEIQNFSSSPIKSKIKIATPARPPAKSELESNKSKAKNNTENHRLKSKIVEIKWDSQPKPKEMEKSKDHKIPTQKQNMKEKVSSKSINLKQDQATLSVKSVIKSSPIKLPLNSNSNVKRSKIPSLFQGIISSSRSETEKDNSESSKDLCSKNKRNDLSSSSTKSSRIKRQNKIIHNRNLTKKSSIKVKTSKPKQLPRPIIESSRSKLTTRRKSKEDIKICTRPNKLPPAAADRKNDINDKIKNFLLKDRIQIQSDRSLIKLKKGETESDSDNRKLKYKASRSRNSSLSLSNVKTDKPSSSSSSRTMSKSKNNDHDRSSSSRSNVHQDKMKNRKDLKYSSSSSKYSSSSHKIEKKVERIRIRDCKSPERDRDCDRSRSNRNMKSLIDIDKVYDTYRKPETSPLKRNTEIERTSTSNKTTRKNIKFSQTREILTSDITKRDRSSIFEKFGIINQEDVEEKYKDEEISIIRRRRMSDEGDKPKTNLISFVAAGKSKIDDVKVNNFQDDDIDQMVNLDNYGNVALKIALKMGFKPGQGLGKKDQGIRIPIEMDRKPQPDRKIRRDGIL